MSFKTAFLVLLIILFGAFIYLKASSLGSDNSTFNRTTRLSLGCNSWVRTVLGLHKDGDARCWYLHKTPGEIVVEVVQPANSTYRLSDDALKDFTELVGAYTGKPVDLFNEDSIPEGTLTDSDLAKIVKEHRRHIVPGEPNLFVVYAQDFAGSDSRIGKTYREYGIVASASKINNLGNGIGEAASQYAVSTLLHEFGHQLGLDHNSDPNCLMNAQVEVPLRAIKYSGGYTVTDFCQNEKNEIAEIAAKFR